jgi:hypothetical protein
MIAGFVVIFTVMAGYLISLVIRWRKLSMDQKMLEKGREE